MQRYALVQLAHIIREVQLQQMAKLLGRYMNAMKVLFEREYFRRSMRRMVCVGVRSLACIPSHM